MSPLLWDILGFLFLLFFFSYNIPVLLNFLRQLGTPHKHEQRHLVYDFYPESVAQRGTQFIKRTREYSRSYLWVWRKGFHFNQIRFCLHWLSSFPLSFHGQLFLLNFQNGGERSPPLNCILLLTWTSTECALLPQHSVPSSGTVVLTYSYGPGCLVSLSGWNPLRDKISAGLHSSCLAVFWLEEKQGCLCWCAGSFSSSPSLPRPHLASSLSPLPPSPLFLKFT